MSAASVLFACIRKASYVHHTLRLFLQQFGALFTTAEVIYGRCPSVGNAIDQRGQNAADRHWIFTTTIMGFYTALGCQWRSQVKHYIV